MSKMKKGFISILGAISIISLAACGNDNEVEESNNDEGGNNNNTEEAVNDEDGLYITASFSVLGDIIEQVIGDRGSVDYLVPIGEEPHEYEPVPSDFRNVSDADVFYTNGMGLEEWLERIVDNASDTEVVSLSEGITEIPLLGEENPDPHAWLSPKNASYYVENLVDDLAERDPEGEELYRENAETFLAEVDELDQWIAEEVESIPEEQRMIVVSENAFKYFGEDYGFRTEGIWEINSHEEGTSGQINRVIDVIQEEDIPAVFVETTVDQRYMETVADNAGVEIAGEVYTDAVGGEGSNAETYLEMMRYNAETLVNGLRN